MALPATWTLVTVTGTFKNKDGTPASGWVTFESRQPVIIGGEIIVPKTITGVIDGSGYLSMQVPATNDPDLSVTGWAYKVTEHIEGGRPPYTIEVPYAGGPINLATVVPAVSTPTSPVTSYLRVQDIGGTVANQNLQPISVKEKGAIGDGVADDSAAFTTAIAAASTAGRPVFVPKGTYQVNNVFITAGVKLFGEGVTSIIRPTAAATYTLQVSGDNVEIYGLNLIAAAGPTVGIRAAYVANLNVHDLRIEGFGSPFTGNVCQNSIVERLTVLGYRDNGISFDGVGGTRNKILSCNVDGTTSGATGGIGVQMYDQTDSHILHNTVNNSYVFGCFMNNCAQSTMAKNITRNTRTEGVQITNCNYCLVDENICSWSSSRATSTTGLDFGISLWANGSVCNYNTVSNNIVINAGKAGIQIEGSNAYDALHNRIIDNTIINPNWLNEAGRGGIMLYGGTCRFTQVMGNKIFSNDGKTYYGIYELSSSGAGAGMSADNKITDNTVIGHATKRVLRQSLTSASALNGNRLSDSTWTPVITSETGTLTTTSSTEALFYEMDRMVYISLSITITTVGTGAGYIAVTLPFNQQSGRIGAFSGRNVANGQMLQIEAGAGQIFIRKPDNTTAISAGGIYNIAGWFERD